MGTRCGAARELALGLVGRAARHPGGRKGEVGTGLQPRLCPRPEEQVGAC